MASPLPLLAVAALVLLPLAAAQAPPLPVAPTSSVTVEVARGPSTVSLGGNGSVPVTVNLQVGNVVCPQPGTATVTLTVNHEPSPLPGIAATLTPSTLTFNLTAQQYASPGFSGSQSATLTYNVGASTLAQHDHSFNVTATFDGSSLAGCSAPGQTVPSSSASASHGIRTGAALGGPGGNLTVTPGQADGNDSAGPELPFLAILALAVVALRRRRL